MFMYYFVLNFQNVNVFLFCLIFPLRHFPVVLIFSFTGFLRETLFSLRHLVGFCDTPANSSFCVQCAGSVSKERVGESVFSPPPGSSFSPVCHSSQHLMYRTFSKTRVPFEREKVTLVLHIAP